MPRDFRSGTARVYLPTLAAARIRRVVSAPAL
jgi:hypothetical protein